MSVRPLALGLVLLLVACSSTEDGPDDPAGPELPGIRATVQTSGRELPQSVGVLVCVDASEAVCQYQSVATNGEVTFPSLAPGDYYVQLNNLDANCSLVGEWIHFVALQDSTVTVGFAIQCRGRGTVRVSTVTSGSNAPTTFEVVHQADCYDYYSTCERKTVASTGSVDFLAFPGSRTFLLEGVADNCAVAAPGNPATVEAIEDGVATLRFEVACQ